jgi:hypothetical protein
VFFVELLKKAPIWQYTNLKVATGLAAEKSKKKIIRKFGRGLDCRRFTFENMHVL